MMKKTTERTMPDKNDPLTPEEITEASDRFFPLFDIVHKRMPKNSSIEDTLKVMENVAKIAQKSRSEEREKAIKENFGFNKTMEVDDA
tara:strand:- start:60 stop:323 length:264 start_codon:yes stop_codon:yes gene_type:complete